MSVTQVYFSPGNTTQAVTEHFTAALSGEIPLTFDLLRDKSDAKVNLSEADLLVVNMPVFAGRIPMTCPAQLGRFTGGNTPAVAMVTYGNREYDDALMELCHILTNNGFKVIAAAAFIARHSIFPTVAAGRPDDLDCRQIENFAHACLNKLQQGAPVLDFAKQVKGVLPTGEYGPHRLYPLGDEKCTRCGICSELCPAQAITPAKPTQTDTARCFGCTACIWNCPVKSRAYRGENFIEGGKLFAAANSARKEPEVFL